MKLNQLSGRPGAKPARKRVGRGIGSGKGRTTGRGHKGQKARSGVAIKGFEGGQMPLHRRLPKRGFHNLFRKHYAILNLGRLQAAIDHGKLDSKRTLTVPMLQEAGLIGRARDGVRLLAKGDLKSKLTIEVSGASKNAVAAVEKAGGKVIVGNETSDKTEGKAEPGAGDKTEAKAEPEAGAEPEAKTGADGAGEES